jgi:signal transduction histidine kinase
MLLRPRLRTVLLTVNLMILLLPVGGIAALRLYENELLRRTEAQLIVQGVMLREAYRQELLGRVQGIHADPDSPPPATPLGVESPPGGLTPMPPRLDVARDRVRPPARDAEPALDGPNPMAAEAGRRLAPIVERSARTTLAGIRVVDDRGVVVATSRSELGRSLAHREEVARALEGETVSLLRKRVSDEPVPPLTSLSRGQRYRVFVALPVLEQERVLGAVVLSRTPLDIAKALYLSRRPIAIGAAVLLAVVFLVTMLTSFTISRPIRGLIRQAEAVSRGEKGAVTPLRSPGTHELARLSEALGEMAKTLETRATYIRTFASHVSHEFKTPLTTIRGTVELLDDHLDEMSAEERRRFLENLTEASDHLERLVRRLLEKARADVAEPGAELTDVAMALDQTISIQKESGLSVTVDQGSDIGHVRMAPETFLEILGNLLENARLHGGDGVRVRVSCHIDRSLSPATLVMTVADDGSGISDANASRVFTPFFTTARARGGSGLGLSIVRSLLEAHGGTIELEPGLSGASFTIRLPSVAPS